MRNTYALIDLNNLKENIEEIKNKYNDYKYYIGVIKANAYGHGEYIVNTLEKAGINYLAVSSLDEAISVRRYNKKLPILCFGYINLKDIDKVIENDITVSIISLNYYKELKILNKKIKVHLKLNTGMNRFGINKKEEVEEIINDIKSTNMFLEGIYTHLATSGVSDIYYDMQINKFRELTSLINLDEIPIIHIFNSLELARHRKIKEANGVRLGLMMYGFTYNVGNLNILNKIKRKIKLKNKKISETSLTNDLKLKKVLSLYSEVVNIINIKKGEFVGYNASYVAKQDEVIAVISIGHADGITDNYKKVIINHQKYDIVSICMDYIMVKVDSNVKIHDKVILIGEDITVGNLSINTTPHHVLVSITDRVKKVYKE